MKELELQKYNITITLTNNNTFINLSQNTYRHVIVLKKTTKHNNLNLFSMHTKRNTLYTSSGGLNKFVGSQKSSDEASTTIATNFFTKFIKLMENESQNRTVALFFCGKRRRL